METRINCTLDCNPQSFNVAGEDERCACRTHRWGFGGQPRRQHKPTQLRSEPHRRRCAVLLNNCSMFEGNITAHNEADHAVCIWKSLIFMWTYVSASSRRTSWSASLCAVMVTPNIEQLFNGTAHIRWRDLCYVASVYAVAEAAEWKLTDSNIAERLTVKSTYKEAWHSSVTGREPLGPIQH